MSGWAFILTGVACFGAGLLVAAAFLVELPSRTYDLGRLDGRRDVLEDLARLNRGVGDVPGLADRGHPGLSGGAPTRRVDGSHPSVRRERGMAAVDIFLAAGIVAGLLLLLPSILGGAS